jgi:hypothetical protein
MKRLNSRLVLGPVLVLAVAVVAIGVVLGTCGGPGQRAVAEPRLPTWAHDIAMANARGRGVLKPTGTWTAASVRTVAHYLNIYSSFTKSALASRTPAYVIVLHGSFVDTKGFGNPGSSDAPRKGTTLTLALDPSLRRVVMFAFGNGQPDLSGFGQFYDFRP